MPTYAIDTGDGSQLYASLPEHTAYRTAQQLADQRGEAVTLYDTDDVSSQRTRTVEPTEIIIETDSPNGPRVTYGAQGKAAVEAKLPDGWSVVWSTVVNLTPFGTSRIACAASLVKLAHCQCGVWSRARCAHVGPAADFVVVEWMPPDLRASHADARNRGVYPHNGAIRLTVTPACADAICAEDGDWTTRL